MAVSPDLPFLTEVIGSRITRARRVHYVYRGVPDTDFGPLELTFADRVVLLDHAADGETLRVRMEPWEDPFAGPLSEQHRAFIETSGKWTAFDVSTVGTFATFIGDVLTSAEPILATSGKVTGMILRTSGGGVVRVDVQADELFLNKVIPGRPTQSRQQ